MKVSYHYRSLEGRGTRTASSYSCRGGSSEEVEPEGVSLKPESGNSGLTIRHLEELGIKPSLSAFVGFRERRSMRGK
jgi:hypothetical protein